MNVIALILLGSVVVVPAVALWSLHWASRTGEFRLLNRAALLPFDDEEPVGQATDQILNRGGDRR
jgi:predicted deacylase